MNLHAYRHSGSKMRDMQVNLLSQASNLCIWNKRV